MMDEGHPPQGRILPEDQREQGTPIKVPTRTALGRGSDFVEVDDPLAAQHWDGRLWTADPL